jgi:hypothetical protein
MTSLGSVPFPHLQDDDDDLLDDAEDFEREENEDAEDADDDDENEDEEDEDAEDGTWYVQPGETGTRRTLTSDSEVPTLARS